MKEKITGGGNTYKRKRFEKLKTQLMMKKIRKKEKRRGKEQSRTLFYQNQTRFSLATFYQVPLSLYLFPMNADWKKY